MARKCTLQTAGVIFGVRDALVEQQLSVSEGQGKEGRWYIGDS